MDLKTLQPGASYFYYPRPLCVVGVWDQGKNRANFVPVAWGGPLASRPPLFGVSLSPTTYSHELIAKTGEFSLSFLPWEAVEWVAKLGAVSGRTLDKVQTFGLQLVEAEVISAPLLAQAYVAAECKVVARHLLGDQTLYVGEVVRVVAREGVFADDGTLRLEVATPILYLGANRYLTVDKETLVAVDGV
ncbi:MAG: flavin reductase family protein [Thermoanaerobaculum sp.]|nr:flavin reductase family protein [Thermoanaerobaculum sp.]MCX7894602.1 flavin reductase family protein [Thermoanaerobaculum sp.]MDW7967286.1 flavin reductase family protein [Thermoanaerobaculum sp.]